MKKILTIIALCFSVAASAADATSTSTTSSVSGSAAMNAGNSQAITFTSPADSTSHVEYSGSQTVKNVPSVSGPNLMTSNDTCMGSTSGSVNIAGLGIGGGTTWVDDNCKMLKNSRELWNMGMKAASLALMCTDPMNAEALKLTGYICPQTQQKSIVPDYSKYSGNDPVVKARLGIK